MSGIEIYDLWLRTGHGDPLDWIEFMCEGEVSCDWSTLTAILSSDWPGALRRLSGQQEPGHLAGGDV